MGTPNQQRKALSGNKQALDAYNAALDATKIETAKTLAKYKNGIAAVLGYQPENLSSEMLASIADSFVETGSFTINQKTYTREKLLEEARKKSNEAGQFASMLPYTAGLFGKVPDAETIIPTHESMTRPAKLISEAVAENTGWMSKIGFAIKGFINWIKDIFDGGDRKGLMDHIHMAAASSIARSAHTKIAAEMRKDPKFADNIGGAEGLQQITRSVYDGTLKAAGSDKPAARLTKQDITKSIQGITPVEKVDPDKWTAAQVAGSAVEVKRQVSNLVQQKVDAVFEDKKFWGDEAKKIRNAASWSWLNPAAYERFTNAESVSNMVKTAIGGGKADQASVLIGNAVGEGVMQTFKGMNEQEIKAALADPSKQSDALAKKIAAKTFASDDWKKIEENINKSSLPPEEKQNIIRMMKEKVQENIAGIIKEKADAIKQAKPMEAELIQVQKKVQGLKTLSDLDANKDGKLSYEELKFLDIGADRNQGDRKISQDELAALPQELRQQFEALLNDPKNNGLKSKDNSLDFNGVAPNTPAKALQLQPSPQK